MNLNEKFKKNIDMLLYLKSLEELQQVIQGGGLITGELLTHLLVLPLQVAVGLIRLLEELLRGTWGYMSLIPYCG